MQSAHRLLVGILESSFISLASRSSFFFSILRGGRGRGLWSTTDWLDRAMGRTKRSASSREEGGPGSALPCLSAYLCSHLMKMELHHFTIRVEL